MDRRRTVSSESVFRRKLKHFTTEFNLFFTYSDWNITAALILSFVTDLAALFLSLSEPFFAICLGYDAFTLYNAIIFYEFLLLVILCFLIFRVANLSLFRCQILILWFHTFGAVLVPFMVSSITSCYPDIQFPRPLLYFKLYSSYPNGDAAHCPSEINNCYRGYFSRMMTVMLISLISGVWHTVVYGIRAWKRLSTISTPHSTPAARPLLRARDDEGGNPLSPDEYDYGADDSSLPSSEAHAPRSSTRTRGKKEMSPRRRLMQTTSSVSSKSTDSSGRC